jgi:hypothetical protein
MIARLIARLFRLDGPTVGFTDPPTILQPGPVLADLGDRFNPGRGRHANGCLYLDEPGHVCVAADGQPTSHYCQASVYARTRLKKGTAA